MTGPPHPASRVPLRRIVRETGLLALVALVTWVTASNSVESSWTSIDAAVTDHRWMLAPAGAAVAVSLLRHRWPALAVVSAGASFGWWPASGIALALTAFEVAGRFTRRRTRIALLAAAGAAGFGVSLLCAQMPLDMVIELHASAALICLALPAVARGQLGKAERVLGALRERAHYLEENQRLAHSAARLQERSRIAQEMHDQLGHRLSLITMYAGALELATTQGAAQPAAEAKLIRGTAQTAMHELRATLGLLRPASPAGPALHPVTENGRRADIERLVEHSRAAGIAVTLAWHGDDPKDTPAPVRQAVHRIVREGLTNVHRHAAGAPATVTIEHRPDAVRVTITNARGPAAAPGADPLPAGAGLGLVGVGERVALLGGEFSAGRTPDGGFRMSARLPRKPASILDVPPTPADLPGAVAARPAPRFSRWARGGGTAVLAAALVGAAALVIVVLTYLPWYSTAYQTEPTVPPPDVVPTPGMAEGDVRAAVGEDDPIARRAARGLESAPPAGSTCIYISDWSPQQDVAILRYCFRAGRLVSQDGFIVAGSAVPTGNIRVR